MNEKRKNKISKSLSYWLRHKPDDIGLKLTKDGWADTGDLLRKANTKIVFDFNELKYVVQNCDKQRFSFSEDFCKIRANQGHSTDVELKFEEVKPPEILYHGTPVKSLDSIKKEGLKKMNRHHVHLSPDIETASKVGSRRGDFIILEIEAMRMRADGHKIYKFENGVYLTDSVDIKYIRNV